MAEKETYHNLAVVKALNPVIIADTGYGLDVDLQGYESCLFVVQTGAVSAADASNFLTVSLVHGDAATPTTAVDSGMIIGTPPVINNTNLANTVWTFAYVGDKRYVRLLLSETLTFSAIIGAVAVRAHARHKPVV